MGIDENLTQEIVSRILTVSKPDRIIMFGSAAMGTMDRDSDISICWWWKQRRIAN